MTTKKSLQKGTLETIYDKAKEIVTDVFAGTDPRSEKDSGKSSVGKAKSSKKSTANSTASKTKAAKSTGSKKSANKSVSAVNKSVKAQPA